MRVEDNIKYKKIMLGIKTIVTDGRGHLTYMDAFDNVINEIFGVPHFSRRLNDSYANREIIDVLERIGSDILYDIFMNKRLYGIMKEMVEMDRRIHLLRKKLRKQGKKGKRDKYDLKEYNWLKKTLKESIKYMRSRFGIKSRRTAYKKKYRNINDVLKKDRYDDDEFMSVSFGDPFDDDYGYDDYDDYDDRRSKRRYKYDDEDFYGDDEDDEDDDYLARSELQDFERMMNGPKPKKKPRNIRAKRSSYDAFDDEDEYYNDEDVDDERFVDDELEDKVDELYKQMMYLSEKIQFLMNKSNHDTARIRNLRDYAVKDMRFKEQQGYNFDPSTGYNFGADQTLEYPRQSHTQEKTEIGILTDFINKLGEQVIQNKKDNKVIAEALDHVLAQNQAITDTFNAILADDDEDDDDEIDYNVGELFSKPKIVNPGPNALDELVNKYEDPYEGLDEVSSNGKSVKMVRPTPEDSNSTVGELIDQINNANDTTATPIDVTTDSSVLDDNK